MLETTLSFLPLVAVFAIGYLLKRTKVMSSADGSTLLNLVFYVGAPALVIQSIMSVQIDANLAVLAFIPVVVVGATIGVTYLLRRTLLEKINYKTFGSILVGAAIMNTGFLLPFVSELYGAEGLARFVVIDAATSAMVFGVVYLFAARIGGGQKTVDWSYIRRKILLSPPIWALVLSLALRMFGVGLSDGFSDAIGFVAQFVPPVILLALGLKFSLKVDRGKLLIYPLVLRYGLGLMIGATFVWLFGLEGLNAQIAIFASLAPIGFNSITFAEMEKLDVKFAAAQVSLSLLISIVFTPLIVSLIN